MKCPNCESTNTEPHLVADIKKGQTHVSSADAEINFHCLKCNWIFPKKQKRGRPPKHDSEKLIPVKIGFKQRELDHIDVVAARENSSRSEYVRRAARIESGHEDETS